MVGLSLRLFEVGGVVPTVPEGQRHPNLWQASTNCLSRPQREEWVSTGYQPFVVVRQVSRMLINQPVSWCRRLECCAVGCYRLG